MCSTRRQTCLCSQTSSEQVGIREYNLTFNVISVMLWPQTLPAMREVSSQATENAPSFPPSSSRCSARTALVLESEIIDDTALTVTLLGPDESDPATAAMIFCSLKWCRLVNFLGGN